MHSQSVDTQQAPGSGSGVNNPPVNFTHGVTLQKQESQSKSSAREGWPPASSFRRDLRAQADSSYSHGGQQTQSSMVLPTQSLQQFTACQRSASMTQVPLTEPINSQRQQHILQPELNIGSAGISVNLNVTQFINSAPIGGGTQTSFKHSQQPGAAPQIIVTNPIIIIVDDNPMNQLITRRQLEMMPFLEQEKTEIIEAGNGQEVLEYLVGMQDQRRVRLILMDCEMPVMDGFEATRHIRESGLMVRIVGFSGNSGESFLKKCKQAGMDDLLMKPVEPAKLEKEVVKAYKEHKRIEEISEFKRPSQ